MELEKLQKFKNDLFSLLVRWEYLNVNKMKNLREVAISFDEDSLFQVSVYTRYK